MATVQSNGITLEYDVSGPDDGAPLVLIHGVGAQMIRWSDQMLAALHNAGFRVIRFDNRDVGLSSHLNDAGIPDLPAVLAAMRDGTTPDLPYSIADMANDVFGLLDALEIGSAHLVGVSLGGMIAQVMAIDRPDRALSLNVVMTHSGNPGLPPAAPEAWAKLATPAPNPAVDREGYISHTVDLNQALGSPGYPSNVETLRGAAEAAADRAYNPAGTARQFAAGQGAPDRRPGLKTLEVPTLVIHGAADKLLPVDGGEDIANNVANAWLLKINGMAHDLPEELTPLFVSAIKANSLRSRLVST